MNDPDCVAFLQWALPRLRTRWADFRKVRRRVCKRIGRRLRELALADLDAYRLLLEREPAEWAHLDACRRVTISRFFRDRGLFQQLGRRVLPALARAAEARGEGLLRAWSAGCASGEEPYTLRLQWDFMLQAEFPGLRLRVTATDGDPALIERARRANFAPGSLRDLPPGWRERAFEERGGTLQLRPELLRDVELRRQDIRSRAPAGPFDLVLCRNLVFTYFEPSLQLEILDRTIRRMYPGAALILGRHESLPPGVRELEPWAGIGGVYRRLGTGTEECWPSPAPNAADSTT